MNKKTKVALLVIGILAVIFVILNVITYALAEKNVIEYFTSEEEEELSGIWDELKRDGRQSVTIDDYTITLEAYLYDEVTGDGYACFSVEREGYDMREETAGEHILYEVNSTFGEDERFTIDVAGSATCETKYKKKKDVMYMYHKFYTNIRYVDMTIRLCDYKTYGEDWRRDENAMYEFKLENNIDNLAELESKYE